MANDIMGAHSKAEYQETFQPKNNNAKAPMLVKTSGRKQGRNE